MQKGNDMQFKRRFFSMVGVLALVAGLTACNSAPPEPEPTPRMSNDELDRLVTAKISGDTSLATYDIDVNADADNNAVTLSGRVPTQSLRTRAVDATKTAHPGLVITDEIVVDPGMVERANYTDEMAREARERAATTADSIGDTLDDAWIHTKIRSRLLAEGEFPGGSLNVDVQANVVTLRGSVATAAEKAKAEDIAKTTDGVTRVRNQLVIKPGA